MRAVPGRNGGAACEVVLVHYEDVGIQPDLAKLAIRRGMWGCVLNMEKGLCAHKQRRRERQRARATPRRSAGASAVQSAQKRMGALPRGGEREAQKPNMLSVVLRTGLMAIGGITVARHSAKVGPQLADAARAVVVAHVRHREHKHKHHHA